MGRRVYVPNFDRADRGCRGVNLIDVAKRFLTVNVAILCYDGVDELDIVGPYRVFAGANRDATPISVSLVAIDSCESVTTSNGLEISIHGRIDDIDPDIVLVPGGGWNARDEASAWAEAERGNIPQLLSELHSDGRTLAGVCTGSMLMERAGILDGRRAVTHAGAIDELRESKANVVNERVVDDGNIITAGGVTSGIDLALHILEREYGEALATDVARNLEYRRQTSILSE